ncbi:hypothetical protein F4775DRAFT_506885 [Biscogniauxia sp. FL1348]|nr:hypothetical protein F4775DRAFT_506885 [Biscogniauxia sp. FL1348]
MPKFRGPLRALHFAAVLAITSATSIRPEWLFERDGVCAADFTKCSQAGLPDNFCCKTGATCIVLAGATTVLCCPEGNKCDTISPITCNISLQDPAANPQAEIKTTVLDGKLETCSTGCCPYGYHCNDNDCVKDDDQSQKPGAAGDATSSATSGPSATSTETASTTPAPESSTTSTAVGHGTSTTAASSAESPDPTVTSNMNTAAIVGGVVGGLIAIIVIISGVLLLRHRRKQKAKKRHSSSSSFGNIISAPVPHSEYSNQRIDFLAKAQSSSIASTPTQAQGRFPPNSPYSPYANRPDSQMSDPPRSYHPSAEVGGLRSLTDLYYQPSRYSGGAGSPLSPGRKHSGGSESINIFADPSTVSSGRRDTTWTDFQTQADKMPDSPLRRR